MRRRFSDLLLGRPEDMGTNNPDSDLNSFQLNAAGFGGSFLLGDHSYDNYLDDVLHDKDVSFAVQPAASSTPASRRLMKHALKMPLARARAGPQALTCMCVLTEVWTLGF